MVPFCANLRLFSQLTGRSPATSAAQLPPFAPAFKDISIKRDFQERMLHINHSKLQIIDRTWSTSSLKDIYLLKVYLQIGLLIFIPNICFAYIWDKPEKFGYDFDILYTRKQANYVTVSARGPVGLKLYVWLSPHKASSDSSPLLVDSINFCTKDPWKEIILTKIQTQNQMVFNPP